MGECGLGYTPFARLAGISRHGGVHTESRLKYWLENPKEQCVSVICFTETVIYALSLWKRKRKWGEKEKTLVRPDF